MYVVMRYFNPSQYFSIHSGCTCGGGNDRCGGLSDRCGGWSDGCGG